MPPSDGLTAPNGSRPWTDAMIEDIAYCYRLYLGRPPDPLGLRAYEAVVNRGISVDELARWFASCPEYSLRMAAQPSQAIARAKLDGFDLYVPTADAVVGEEILAGGVYEPHVTAAMLGVLAQGQTVIDVGANIGYYTLLAATKVGPGGSVIAFEPLARNVKLLFANARINNADNITIHPYGASDAEGLITLLSTGSIASSRDPRLEDAITVNGFDMAYARTIDSVVPPGRNVDLIKIDIDGFDHRAMLGARATMTRCHPHIFAEFAPDHLVHFSGVQPIEYLKLFLEHGYNDFTVMTRGGMHQSFGVDIDRIAQLPGELNAALVDLHIRRI